MKMHNIIIEMFKVNNNNPPYQEVLFRLYDQDSNTVIFESRITIEEFANLVLNGSTFSVVTADVNTLKIGMKQKVQYVEFEVPNDQSKSINSYFAEKIDKYVNDGWNFSVHDIGNSEYLTRTSEETKTYTIKMIKWE